MTKFRTMLRRHILWVGFFAVAIPLVSILAIQYRSLAKLEKASVLAESAGMKNYLDAVSKNIKYFYKDNAEQALNVPAHLLAAEGGPSGRSRFGACSVEGAKRLFLVSFGEGGEARTLYFDPSDASRPSAPAPAEQQAVQLATATFRLFNKEGTPIPSGHISEYTRDPDNKIVMKPVLDDSRRVVGVAGMILDTEYFKQNYLPRVVRETLPKFFPEGAHENVIVSAHDMKKQIVFSTQPPPFKVRDDETAVGLPYFYEYALGIRSRHMTPAQWARQSFRYNFTLSVLMTVVLVGGIALALRTASRELKVSQMKTDFVSNVSHELRTPLSSIRVFGEFLKLGRVRDGEKIREYGEYIETESRRLTQLINNILDFSKIESDRKIYHFERADVGEIVAATLKTFDVQLKQHGFSVDFHAPAQPLAHALVDPDALAQAFMNLLDNAVKYSGESKQIHVQLDQREREVRVSVTDFGVGIPPEEHGKIFEKFYRVSTGLVHDVKGSGLGLALVEHIVKAHGGRVRVESEPGRGSTFTIHLPAAEGASGRAEKPEEPARVLKGATSRV